MFLHLVGLMPLHLVGGSLYFDGTPLVGQSIARVRDLISHLYVLHSLTYGL